MATSDSAPPVAPIGERAPKNIRRRSEIMDAAAEIFARKGYHAATTRDIADRLGMQAGSLYYYLESKEAALEEVCRVGSEAFESEIADLLKRKLTAREMARAGIAMHLQSDKRHYVTCFVYSRRLLAPAVVAVLNDRARRYVNLWSNIFARGVAEGAFAPELDCRGAAFAVMALCNGAVPNLETRAPAETAKFVAGLTDLFLNGVLRRPGAAADR